MPTNLRPLAQQDFSGGLNLVVNPYLIGPKQLADGSDMILDEHGSLRVRDGITTIRTSPDTSNKLLYRGVLTKTDGTTTEFAIQRKTASVNTVWNTGTSPWTSVGDLTTAEDLPDTAQLVDVAVIVNGYETPKKFNGTTLTAITAIGGQTVPPGAKHASFHLGSLWLWNTNATTTTLDGKSSLRMSASNNPDDWPNANQTFISKDDGQVGMGMTTFTIVETGISPTATLVLFKNFSTYQVTGIFGSASFSVQRIKSDMGCTAPRTIQFVSGFGVIRLTHKGFALYNGVEDRLISEEVRPVIFGGRGFSSLDFTNVEKSWAAQSQNPPLYIAACPVSGAALTRIFVYDLIRRAWTIMTLPVSLTTMALFFTPTTAPVVHGGTIDGKIVDLYNGATTDNGAKISWFLKTRAFFLQNPLENSYWRRVQVLLEASPNQKITITPIIDGVTGTALDRLMPDSTASTVESVLGIDIMQTARTCQLKVNGIGFVRVRGLELHVGSKPVSPAKVTPL